MARDCMTYRTAPSTPQAIATLTRPDNARKVARIRKAAMLRRSVKPFDLPERVVALLQSEYRCSRGATSTCTRLHAASACEVLHDGVVVRDRATLHLVEVVREGRHELDLFAAQHIAIRGQHVPHIVDR